MTQPKLKNATNEEWRLYYERKCREQRKEIAALRALNLELARTCGCLDPDENGRPCCNPPCIACQATFSTGAKSK